jgi:7,8-dihydropterin-6-yl-methyl-4-(beta-D-ribofuranosyl)aminobenzene 5'-phosphate synthase
MSDEIRITVLVENSVHRGGLMAEHGLSFHIQTGERSLLFDTGQTDLVLRNAAALRVPLDRIEAVVLSHGHYDHTGGVTAVQEGAPMARWYANPAVFARKYGRNPQGETRFIGMSPEAGAALRRHRIGFVETGGWTEVMANVFATGEIPRATGYEDTGGAFFLDETCSQPDPLTDDQALVIDLGRSIVVLLGCAHAGVVNTLDHVERLAGGKPIRAVVGGFHLGSASEERIRKTIARLGELNLDCLAPVHCTGWPATAALWQSFPRSFRLGGVGTVFNFETD